MLNDIIYSGIKINEQSKNKILKLFEPKFNKIYADHLTLFFGVTDLPIKFGEQTNLQIARYVFNNKCQAIECKILDNKIKCDNIHPHITISTADDTKPVYSNTLLDLPESKCISVNIFNQEIILIGTIGVYTKTGWKFSEE